jgi:hypothetical protein
VAGSCEHNNKPLGSIKGREFLDWLSNCYINLTFGLKCWIIITSFPLKCLPSGQGSGIANYIYFLVTVTLKQACGIVHYLFMLQHAFFSRATEKIK